MRDPKKLEVTDQAMQLAELTYRVTKGFPPDERFGLVSQMRRAAISVGSNISEGCGRTTDRAFASFLGIALGSALELEYQACIAMRLGHGDGERLHELRDKARTLIRMLASFNAAVRRRKSGSDLAKSSAVPIRERAAPPAP